MYNTVPFLKRYWLLCAVRYKEGETNSTDWPRQNYCMCCTLQRNRPKVKLTRPFDRTRPNRPNQFDIIQHRSYASLYQRCYATINFVNTVNYVISKSFKWFQETGRLGLVGSKGRSNLTFNAAFSTLLPIPLQKWKRVIVNRFAVGIAG